MITCYFTPGKKTYLRHTVVDIIAIKDNKVLLVKRSMKLVEGGKWAIPGGFMERDETIKEAAKREYFEETGWVIDNLNLLTVSDSLDPVKEERQNISFVFIANPIKKTGQPDWESTEIKWFDLNNLPSAKDTAFNHLEYIKIYQSFLDGKVKLPVF